MGTTGARIIMTVLTIVSVFGCGTGIDTNAPVTRSISFVFNMYGKLCLPQRRAGGVQAVENRPLQCAWAVENLPVKNLPVLAKLLIL